MIRLGSIRFAGEVVEVWHDPRLESLGEFDSEPDPPRIVIRDRDRPKRAYHELGHALVWAHCLSKLFRRGGEEALCGALEISLPDAYDRLRLILEGEPEPE